LIAFPIDNRITTSLTSNNNTDISTTSSPGPKINVENPIYEYDAIKLEQESIDKSASIGVADLDNTNNSSRVELKDIDLSKCSELLFFFIGIEDLFDLRFFFFNIKQKFFIFNYFVWLQFKDFLGEKIY
jgi:hypothetical protein